MDFSTATYLLFGAAIACGFIAYRRTASLGGKLQPLLREATRLTFALCVVLAVWGCVSFALWACGAPLKIVAITEGQMHKAWWLGPAALIWSVFSFCELRRST